MRKIFYRKQNHLPTSIEINSRSAGSVAPTEAAARPKIVSAAILCTLFLKVAAEKTRIKNKLFCFQNNTDYSIDLFARFIGIQIPTQLNNGRIQSELRILFT